MRSRFRLSDLVPPDLAVDGVSEDASTIIVNAKGVASSRPCPRCGTASVRVHSRYIRTVSDLPCCGRRVALRLMVRRFVCTATHCRQKVFAERFGEDVLAP